jgi:hypothetical protein
MRTSTVGHAITGFVPPALLSRAVLFSRGWLRLARRATPPPHRTPPGPATPPHRIRPPALPQRRYARPGTVRSSWLWWTPLWSSCAATSSTCVNRTLGILPRGLPMIYPATRPPRLLPRRAAKKDGCDGPDPATVVPGMCRASGSDCRPPLASVHRCQGQTSRGPTCRPRRIFRCRTSTRERARASSGWPGGRASRTPDTPTRCSGQAVCAGPMRVW